jgi:hypothetical protein
MFTHWDNYISVWLLMGYAWLYKYVIVSAKCWHIFQMSHRCLLIHHSCTRAYLTWWCACMFFHVCYNWTFMLPLCRPINRRDEQLKLKHDYWAYCIRLYDMRTSAKMLHTNENKTSSLNCITYFLSSKILAEACIRQSKTETKAGQNTKHTLLSYAQTMLH